jgi:phospholipase/lecithinase/hemolysin
MMIRTVTATGLALSALFSMSTAQAYDKLVVFGDSLADNGNIYGAIFGYLPTKPYFNGRFSNGPVSVEVMADKLGIPLVDYAFGGASSGVDNEYLPGSNTGLRGQIDAYLGELQSSGGAVDQDDLFIVSGGGNDLLSAAKSGKPFDAPALVAATVDNMAGNVKALYDAGARDVMVPLLPDMGTSYYGTSGQISATLLSSMSDAFNAALSTRLGLLDGLSPNLTLRIFDTPSVVSDLRDSLSANGGNIVDRCWTGEFRGAGTLCANPDTYYLFDRVHPTAIVHRTVGLAMAAAVPEAESLAMAGAGLLTMAWLAAARRRKAARWSSARASE